MYISIICLNNDLGFFLSQSFTVAALKCIEVRGLCMSAGIEGVTQMSNSSHGFICCVSCSSAGVLHSVLMYKHMRWGSTELTVGDHNCALWSRQPLAWSRSLGDAN